MNPKDYEGDSLLVNMNLNQAKLTELPIIPVDIVETTNCKADTTRKMFWDTKYDKNR